MSTVIIKCTGKYYAVFKPGTHQPFVREVSMCLCVYVYPLRLLITNGVMWHGMYPM